MTRDMDLVRKLLFVIEEMQFTGRLENPAVEGYSPEAVDHHVFLMQEASWRHMTSAGTAHTEPRPRSVSRGLVTTRSKSCETTRSGRKRKRSLPKPAVRRSRW